MNRREFFKKALLGLGVLSLSRPLWAKAEKEVGMVYKAKEYPKCLGMKGFSESLIKNHMTLYQGYVANTNRLLEIMAGMTKEGRSNTPEFAELKRRLGWEFNGMRLHEYYFENLGGKSPLGDAKNFRRLLEGSFGSMEAWEKEFKATGQMRGIGWVVLYHDPVDQRLINFWINEHDVGHPAGLFPVLVMDVFEHAYMIDYGLKRAEYIEAFFNNIDWGVVEARVKTQ